MFRKSEEEIVALAPIEITLRSKILTRESKIEFTTSMIDPFFLVLDMHIISEIRRISVTIFEHIGITHYARIDFRMNSDTKQLFAIDVNERPTIFRGQCEYCDFMIHSCYSHNELLDDLIKEVYH